MDKTGGELDELEALACAFALKDERRTGWQLRGIEDPETVADHSWGVALLCLVYSERAGIDPDRALRLAVIHDIAEAETGDVATRVDPEKQTVSTAEKEVREREAMADIAAPFDFLPLWEEYEARETAEARFVKDMDLIDMCLQALVYEREGRYEKGENEAFERFEDLDEFFATAEPRLRTEVGKELFSEIRERYEAARQCLQLARSVLYGRRRRPRLLDLDVALLPRPACVPRKPGETAHHVAHHDRDPDSYLGPARNEHEIVG